MGIRISAVAAIGENRELGKGNQLLWHIPEDLKRFKTITSGHPVIMGRKTYESIGRLLPNRTNVIITRDNNYAVAGALIAHSLQEAIEIVKTPNEEEIFVIGGGHIFKAAMPFLDRIYLTIVHKSFPDADVYFPEYSLFTKEIERSEGKSGEYSYTFLTLEKP